MNYTDYTESTASSVFLLSMPSHLIFCVLAFAFFIFRYVQFKRSYQLFFALAMPSTLILRLGDFISDEYSKTFTNIFGAIEIVLFFIGIVLIIYECIKSSKIKKLAENKLKNGKDEEENV